MWTYHYVIVMISDHVNKHFQMADPDPETLLEWLNSGVDDERDMQLIALEQLCMLLLMSDNVDRCFESCPPRTFLPALCRIFLDDQAPENVLEVKILM